MKPKTAEGHVLAACIAFFALVGVLSSGGIVAQVPTTPTEFDRRVSDGQRDF